jgi:hypothetical protein
MIVMLRWACTSAVREDGRALIRELADPLRRWLRGGTPASVIFALETVTRYCTQSELIGGALTLAMSCMEEAAEAN